MKILRRIAIVVVAAAVALVAVELSAQLFVRASGRGKLFAPDATLGWRVLGDLDRTRRNPDGSSWHVRTDGNGRRRPLDLRDDAITRVLIVGDSFAFGQGVEIDQRFDSLLAARRPDWGVGNLGVMGYGTGQQLISARGHADRLRRDDALVVLTFYNDFYDLLRRRFSGRAKPWFELDQEGRLVEHAPEVTWKERWRDRSYLFSILGVALETVRRFEASDVQEAARIYAALLEQECRGLLARGVRVVVAHHGFPRVQDPAVAAAMRDGLDAVCAGTGIECLDLDPALPLSDPGLFYSDEHWTAEGHRIVAEELAGLFEAPVLTARQR